VGDLVRGFTEDKEKLAGQWDEFCGITEKLDMPFFYVPGGHDTGRAETLGVWRERFGPTYYWFVYKDVLFITLHTYDTPDFTDGVSRRQIDWAKKTIADHAGVRWTFLFMHAPLWRGTPADQAAMAEIEKAFGRRPYTVFAGHWHRYISYVRNGREYYILSTTGGANKLEGPDQGRFDHVTWVSMTDEGPKIVNILLDGMLTRDVYTDVHGRFNRFFGMVTPEPPTKIPFEMKLSFRPTNPYKKKVSAKLAWSDLSAAGWRVTPAAASVVLRPGETGSIDFKVSYDGPADKLLPPPVCEIEISADGKVMRVTKRRVPIDPERLGVVERAPSPNPEAPEP